VFLLHGLDDNIIPTSESAFAADYLRAQGNRRVELLLTPIIAHADLADEMPIRESWKAVRFWREMLSVAEGEEQRRR
jgi:predicted esterase